MWNNPRLTRRTWLKSLAASEFCALVSHNARAGVENQPPPSETVAAYLNTLNRPGGGYAWDDQTEPHLTPTFAAVGCAHLLNIELPNRSELIEFIRQSHPARLKKLEQEHRVFEFQQIQSLDWLDADPSRFRDQVKGWTAPERYLKQYERNAYPVFRFQLTAFNCRNLLNLPLDDLADHFVSYLYARRRANGSFNNTPTADGGDGHVLNTWWGLQALQLLGRESENRAETVAWLRSCQLPCGGFTYQPHPPFGGVDDLAYTWAAVRALSLLKAEPDDRASCLRYLQSLWNPDGGAGDRPSWSSNPLATFRALDALNQLGEPAPKPPAAPRSKPPALPKGLRVWSAQIEAHGEGSPAEAVALAKNLRIHLWGAKNARAEWLIQAQDRADQANVPVRFFVSNEEYGSWVHVPGLGTYSHMSDIIAPAGVDFGPPLTGQQVPSWPDYRERRLRPLHAAGGRLIWQFGENEELVRILLDDSIERGGFAAISTFHFGNPDFTITEPFLNRYRGRLPFVALQDAHGPEPWWFADKTAGFRTLFLANEPTWDAWLDALRLNRVVAVRHDAVSGFQTWMHGGSRAVLDLIKQHQDDWQWWDNPSIQRPLVSLVAVKPGDVFEAARPETGVTLRVRCAWTNTPQGLAKEPITEFVRLQVDGRPVSPELVAKPGNGPLFKDHYHRYHLPHPSPGNHSAEATVRVIATGAEHSTSITFSA